MNSPNIPAALVHYVAQGLIERSVSIKILPTLMREISPAPLPKTYFVQAGLTATCAQWQLSDRANTSLPLLERLKSTVGIGFTRQTWAQLSTGAAHQPAAQLVFAPLVLDAAEDVLQALACLPAWFADDGVLLFATLAAGGLPELVNAQPEWLELLGHWPSIMDAGARLQDLRFGLPVLDVEAVPLSYSDFNTTWHDVTAFVPALRHMDTASAEPWKERLRHLFDNGLRDLSLQVLYGQVWQPTAPKSERTEHTVSLESLTAQLEHRRTFK
ncbi:hypothetical protein [Hydromonas duriensis]|uniref:Uncharacterized protein n=1 Tax=Hydromonas duriensis TaxID=1527608 RepID=A0A4R6YAI3_9BURK|nr:hypothetical protein [Hydromonas duriensis]TDR32577.1 hypothetical protein DFR44_10390 [Hydromonas duriensis]